MNITRIEKNSFRRSIAQFCHENRIEINKRITELIGGKIHNHAERMDWVKKDQFLRQWAEKDKVRLE